MNIRWSCFHEYKIKINKGVYGEAYVCESINTHISFFVHVSPHEVDICMKSIQLFYDLPMLRLQALNKFPAINDSSSRVWQLLKISLHQKFMPLKSSPFLVLQQSNPRIAISENSTTWWDARVSNRLFDNASFWRVDFPVEIFQNGKFYHWGASR